MTTAGFLGGVIAPSRDMLVRDAAPAGAPGAHSYRHHRLHSRGIVSPLLFGWIMDRNWPQWVFGASVVFMILTACSRLSPTAAPRPVPKRRMQGLCIPEPHPRRLTASRENS